MASWRRYPPQHVLMAASVGWHPPAEGASLTADVEASPEAKVRMIQDVVSVLRGQG